MARKKKLDVKENMSLLNLITPIGLEFSVNKLRVGENIGSILGITQYYSEPQYGWCSNYTNTPGTIIKFIWLPKNDPETLNAISRNITINWGKANSARDPQERIMAEELAAAGEKTLKEIGSNGESIGLLITLGMATSIDEEGYKLKTSRLQRSITATRCRDRFLSSLQMQGYKSLSPYWPPEKEVEEIFGRVCLLSAFMGGIPFVTDGFNDKKGYYFGKDLNGGLIILDTWKRGNDRTNSNMAILGAPGSGKSTAMKHLIVNEFSKGTKLLLIDPENEYDFTTKQLGGIVIDAGGGEGIINPLQIRPVPIDDNEESEKLYNTEKVKHIENEENKKGCTIGSMALHLKTLEVFFSLYLDDVKDMQMAILLEILEKLYNKWDIFWDTDVTKLSAKDFPIMEDLYTMLLEKGEEKKESIRENEENIYLNLAQLLRSIAIGADSVLFNGYTSLDTKIEDSENDDSIVCLNTFQLQNTSDRIRRAQYYNLLTWCWQIMTQDRTTRYLFMLDEAYLMIDPDIKEALMYLRNMAKRGRKYETGIVVASQSVVDFLDPKIKMYGQALLNLATYKLVFGTDGQDLKELEEIFNFKEHTLEFLRRKIQGRGAGFFGNKLIHFDVDIPDDEWELIGTKGGRGKGVKNL